MYSFIMMILGLVMVVGIVIGLNSNIFAGMAVIIAAGTFMTILYGVTINEVQHKS